jgi:hypothetical protein
MTARFDRAWAKASRANLAASVSFMRPLSASQSACAALCRGEIPDVRVITNRQRRQKANLSEACRAVFE